MTPSRREHDAGRTLTLPPASGLCLGFVVWQAVLIGDYFAHPSDGVWLWALIGFSSVVATVAGIHIHHPQRPGAWYLLAASELCFIAGDTSYRVLTDVLGKPNPFPSIADAFYLATYPLLAAGFFVLIRGRMIERDTAALLDALIIVTGLSLLSWAGLVEPYSRADGLASLQRLVSIGYPLGDVLVVSMLAHLVAAGGLRVPATRLLLAGAAALLVSDVCYGWIQINGTWRTGTPVDMGRALYYTAWGAACLHPSMRHVDQVTRRPAERFGRTRVVLMAAASLIPPAVLLSQAIVGPVTDGIAIAGFAATSFILVIARLSRVVATHRQSLSRERVLRSCGEALVAAQSLQQVYQAVLDGVRVLRGRAGADREASLYVAEDGGGVVCVASTRFAARLPADEVCWAVACRGGDLDGTGRVSVTPVHRDKQVSGMLVVGSGVPISWDEHCALVSLAAEAALAIDTVRLATDLRQRESEARFRVLVQNASDVILVVDPTARIIYAAPSIHRTLGRPVNSVLGTSLYDLLHDDDIAGAWELIEMVRLGGGDEVSPGDWRLASTGGEYVAFEILPSDLQDDPAIGGIVLTMRDVSQRQALEHQLTQQAFHDRLTGLPNRALFHDRAEQALARASRRGTHTAIVMLDVDGFKDIRLARGTAVGDEMLRQVAQHLVSALPAQSTLARLGDDEFAVVVEDVPDGDAAELVAHRLLAPFAAPFLVQGERVLMTASAGLVLNSGTEADLDLAGLLRCGELALYAAKEHGRGPLVRYEAASPPFTQAAAECLDAPVIDDSVGIGPLPNQ